ncbi:MAG TPA: glycoside hydrolase family 3 C-terminal domain-containing protein [Stellaceae bacterium]|nr:glycoside hydrolase family 3 C-terminal domain-containing protein [Stellaceae bacterium]
MLYKPHFFILIATLSLMAMRTCAVAGESPDRPWTNRTLSPDARADLVIQQMTTDEKLALVVGTSQRPEGETVGAAGYVAGLPRLGIPMLKESNAELGVAIPPLGDTITPEDEATALPSGLATAATWNPAIAHANGAMIAEEARRKGFNVLLGGAVNLARDPRSGRNFEYAGEDPLLAGTIVGAAIRGIQDKHVISTVKHFAINDQETNRTLLDARINMAALRESDLLAFELAIEQGRPGAVMCSYNLLGGIHACENPTLLDKILRQDWHFPGWVMSDWGAVHSTSEAVRAGLDQESGADWDSRAYFGDPLAVAVAEGSVTTAQLDTMAHRILRTMFESGVIDNPPVPRPLDVDADMHVAQRAEEEGLVLLRNEKNFLPLSPNVRRIAVIGGHADIGVLSGGGSSQVVPIGGPALRVEFDNRRDTIPFAMIFDPSSPLRAIAAHVPRAQISFADGENVDTAAATAKSADIAIVFATAWEIEGHDSENLALPRDQDKLIAAVAAANQRTIVVLETGNPVTMPWADRVGAIIEAWYPGSRGGEAIANVLFGTVNPSGRLPITFPASTAQLPRPDLPGRDIVWNTTFKVDYREGEAVGYKWFEQQHARPLYPFGFGLSYTQFRYSDLRISGSKTLTASFTVTNTGKRAGADVPQVYASVSTKTGMLRRLIGWNKVSLAPGESKRVRVTADPRLLAQFDEAQHGWHIAAGNYRIELGASASDLTLAATAKLGAQILPP